MMRTLLAVAMAVLPMLASASKIAVIGCTGKVGRCAVQKLVSSGYTAKVLLRSPVKPDVTPSIAMDADSASVAAYLSNLDGVEAVNGDVTDRSSLDKLLEGCTAVLALHGARRTRKLSDFWSDPTNEPTHAKQINYEGVKNLIDAAKASRTCKRIVRLTGKGETPWSFFSIMINGLGGMAKAWNYEGELLLRAAAGTAEESGLEYTIVRPGVMRGEVEDFPASSLALADNGGDLKVTSIPHATIASLCVESLACNNVGRSTLCAMASEVPGEGADDWKALLAGVEPDSRTFRTDLLAEHTKAVRIGGTAIAAGALGFALAVATALFKLAGLLASLVRLVLAR